MYKVHWWLRYTLCWSWQHVLRNCVVHINLAEGKTSVVQSWILKVPLSTNWASELSLEPRSHSNHWPAHKKSLELDTLVKKLPDVSCTPFFQTEKKWFEGSVAHFTLGLMKPYFYTPIIGHFMSCVPARKAGLTRELAQKPLPWKWRSLKQLIDRL